MIFFFKYIYNRYDSYSFTIKLMECLVEDLMFIFVSGIYLKNRQNQTNQKQLCKQEVTLASLAAA